MSEQNSVEEDAPALSVETFTALAEFYAEQENREKELQSARIMAAEGAVVQVLTLIQD
jgi:hypothetical protein